MTGQMPGGKSFTEKALENYLAENIETLPCRIQNLKNVVADLAADQLAFNNIDPHSGGPDASDLLGAVLRRNASRTLERLEELCLAGVGVPLLETGCRGFKPSADLIAFDPSTGTMFLIEVKKALETEREVLTELAAYTHGLHNRFWGMGSRDLVWMPISTEWRAMPVAAIINEMLCASRAILPLKAFVTSEQGIIKDVKFDVLPLGPVHNRSLAASLFAMEAFDCTIVSFKHKPNDYEELLQHVSLVATRLGYSGFCFLTDPNAPGFLEFPYHLVIGAQNPYKSARIRYRGNFENDLAAHGSAATSTFPSLEENGWGWDDIVYASENRLTALTSELGPILQMFGIPFELSAPPLAELLEDRTFLTLNLLVSVQYFGLAREVIEQRLGWEFRHRNDDGEGPFFGVMKTCPLSAMARPETFFTYINLLKCRSKEDA